MMSTGEDEPSTGLNGRLRPRKSNPSPQTKKILRKPEAKIFQDRPKRITTLSKAPPNKTDDLDNKSDNTTTPQLLCPYCDKKFISKQTVSKHAHRIHLSSLKQDSYIDCLFCNHAESESNGIIRHMVDSHPNQYFACLECHTRFSSTSDLAEHKLNVCEKQKLPYRSKLRQKPDSKKNLKSINTDPKDSFENHNKEFSGEREFNGIVISCELKPTQGRDEADIEDNITTNLILPSGKGISHKAVIEKNAVIVLDDIQWNKRLPANFSFHNTDTDQILSRLGVVHKSPRSGEPKKDWQKNHDDVPQKFEKCFDTSFYSKVASNVQENLSKYLDGSFNPNPEPDSTIKTRKSKNSIAINTAEGFPILLACEQYSRNLFDGYMPRAIAPKHKWKWDSPESDKDMIDSNELKRDAHLDSCIITYVSNLDIWTQLSMRRKFENKSNKPVEKRAEKQNIISKELKEILESREIPASPSQESSKINNANSPVSGDGASFPSMLGLTPAVPSNNQQPAILSGEWVRPRCYVCCACGAQTRDPRALSSHISTHHPNAQVQHYEIVGEPLLDADILKHLYVPPSQTLNRSRPLRGFRECTKCKKSVTLEDLHQHMLDCAGDTPTIRRKCRYRPFGVRKRRPRLPDNRIRRKMRKDMRTGQSNDKNHFKRPRPKTKSEVGDAETIRKMLADLPAKRHRVMVNPLNSFPRRKHDRKCNSLMVKKRPLNDRNFNNKKVEPSTAKDKELLPNPKINDCGSNNEADEDEDEDDDDLPLKPKLKAMALKNTRQKESLNRKATMNRTKRKSNKEFNLTTESANETPVDYSGNNQPAELSMNNTPNRVNINGGPNNAREHSNRGGSNNRDDQQPGSSRQNGNSRNFGAPPQNPPPLKHSIARLTADSETHDKSVQFHRLFLVQQECNNLGQRHVPSDRRLLFENEAVVTKLDKPPLHFNPRAAIDVQNQPKNKNNKPRKRLNDCIAMLKNKLTPNNEDDLPGHVSVQCGSDEPIEQEPFLVEHSIYVAQSCTDTVKDPSQQESLQVTPLGKNDIEHSPTNQIFDSPMKVIAENEQISTVQCKINNKEIEGNEGNETMIITQKSESPKTESIQLTKTVTPEIEITHTDTIPLPLPRNTVIRKSPKISVNYANSQEELKTPFKSSTIQQLEFKNNDTAAKNVKNQPKSNKLKSIQPERVSKTSNKRQNVTIKEKNDSELDKTLKMEVEPSEGITGLNQNNLNTQVNICEKEGRLSNEMEIDQNLATCPNVNMELPSTDFRDIPCTIPPAHASTNVESIVSTPLDLSGKKSRTSISSTDDTLASDYDSYETLDLSNKNIDVDQGSTLNPNLIDDLPTDVVVDLSIKSSQSAHFSRKTTEDKIDGDLSYESLNDNLPTDLSVKKNNTTSVPMIPQNCKAVDNEIVQDLSSTKRQEIIAEHATDSKDLPTDLSSNRIDDSSIIIEIIDNENENLSNQELNEELHNVEMFRNTTQKHVYDHSGVNLIREMEEPLVNTNNDHIDMQIRAESAYVLESTDIVKSVTPILQQSILPNSNVTSHGASHYQLKDTEDTNNLATITVQQKFEKVTNQISTPFIENTVIVPQESIHYEIESSILGSMKTTNSTLPLYSMNRNVTMQAPVCTYEDITTARPSSNVCISVAKADTSSSPRLVNSLPTILTAAMTATGSDYSRVETSVSSNNNFIDLSSESDGTKHKCEASDGPDHYDLTKEEIIDCEIEPDNDTARKIAMLPKEIVKILGTMPIDHRKQLLDVLPQYVSTSAYIESGELIVTQNTIPDLRSPSPVLQQIVSDYAEDSSKDRTHASKNASNENRSHPRSNMCPASSSSSLMISKDSIPQSVILKAPVATNDVHYSMSKHLHNEYTSKNTPDVNCTVSVLNRPSKLITSKKEESTIIDLTGDENIKEIHNDKQFVDSNLTAVKEVLPFNQTVQPLSEPTSLKGNSEQTASLRAVRIKAPSERIKQAASDCRKESLCVNRIPEVLDYIDKQTLIMDSQNIDEQRKYHKQKAERAKNISSNELYLSPVKQSDASKSFDEQFNISVNPLSKSSVILTPTSLEKNVKASSDERYGNSLNQDLTNISTISSQGAENWGDEVIEVNNTIAPMQTNLPPNTDKCNLIGNTTSPNKKNITNNEEDSEDDISLAVIVQQKHRKQAELSGDNRISTTKEDEIDSGRKKKKGKRSKKVLLKTLKNDDDAMVNTIVNKRLRVEIIDIDPHPLVSNTDKMQLITEEKNIFAEERIRKAKNRDEMITSAEGLCRTEKIDNTFLDLDVKRNLVAKGDMVEKKIDASKNKLKDDTMNSLRRDRDLKSFITINREDIYTSSSGEVKNIAESDANNAKELVQGNSENSQHNSEKVCIEAKYQIGVENDKSVERNLHKEFNLNTDTSRGSCQFNQVLLNKFGTAIKEHLDQEKSQKKQEIEPVVQVKVKPSDISTDSKSKKGRKRNKTKDSSDSDTYKPQSTVTFDTESSVTPLRRSRRGKSMYVDNTLVDSGVTSQNEITVDKKAPLTKKQLIFSKLLLDEENISKPDISAVIAKNPVVVISNVDLSSHMNLAQNKLKNNIEGSSTIYSKPVKSFKRKKSPQTKKKAKKLKTLDNTEDENISKSVILNNNDETANTDCHEPSNYNTPVQASSNVMNLKDNEALPTTEKEKVNSSTNDLENKTLPYVEGSADQSANCDTVTKPATIEKRKISCSLAIADSTDNCTSKKSKFDNTIEFGNKASEEKQQDPNEICGRSRARNNYTDTKNKTCYNSHVAVRRTRSKSVGVKSSTLLYDPYDIELEDMVDKDVPYGRRLKSSDNSFNNLAYVKQNEIKRFKKCETSVGVNTEPINSEAVTETTLISNAKEDVSDSDDSSKSDVPLKKLAEEKEKKNSELSGNKKVLSEDKESYKSEKKIGEEANQQSANQHQENNQGRKSEQSRESSDFFPERKPRKSNVIATKKNTKTFNTNEVDDGIHEFEENTFEIASAIAIVNPIETALSRTNSSTARTVTTVATTTDASTTSASATYSIPVLSSTTDANATTAAAADTTAATTPLTDVTTTTALATGATADAPAATAPSSDATTTSEADATVTAASSARATTATTLEIPTHASTTTGTSSSTTPSENGTKQEEENISKDTQPSSSKTSAKRGQIKMKVKTDPILEEFNFLIAYKQQLHRFNVLTEKVAKRKKTSKAPSKPAIPSVETILATVNKTVSDQQLSRRNLSRDEALFLDCCELLKESHKPEISATTEDVTVTTEAADTTTCQDPADATEGTDTAANNTVAGDNKSDGDVDSITAKNILESEEVRNLENDLICGLKEAAANSLAACITELQPTNEIQLEKPVKDNVANPPVPQPQAEHCDSSEKIAEEPSSTSKPKKNQEVKEKMYPDVVDSIDMFEDKFDKIKRKCRSQAAAAKQVKPVVEPRLRQKGRKKCEKKRGKKSTKKTPPAIPTKGALKVFDGIKVSIPTSEINMSGVSCTVEHTPKRRKRNYTKKKSGKSESESKHKYNSECKVKGTQTKKVDVYEFMDNEDAELFEFRPSTLMERFKNINSRDMPSTSKYGPRHDKTDYSSESCSDGDDFVYDDYVCSDEETENSLMSCELGNAKSGNETKKCSSSIKRKDVVEKNAVMGKIFKHNAVRPEKKISKPKDSPKPRANLDQLFDSLLQDEPGPSTSSYKSLKLDEFVSPRKHDLSRKHDSANLRKYECLTPRKHEVVTTKKHEFSTPTKRESVSPKKHGYSSTRKYESSGRGQEAEIRKHDSALSRKHEYESYRKYHSSGSRRYECLALEDDDDESPRKEESVSPKKHESTSSRKHDATSKYNSGKSYPLSSALKKDSGASSKTYDRSSKRSIFDDKPSTSKKYNSSSRDVFRTSPKTYDSLMYSPSIHEPSTSKMNFEGRRSSKGHDYSSGNEYSSMKRHGSSSKKFDYEESLRRYSRDKSLTPDLDEDNESISDCGVEKEEEAAVRDAGVARQRARRKCTVGKQNVLAETWSSESDPDPGPGRPASAESVVSPVSRKKRGRKREVPVQSVRRARPGPVKRQDLEARVTGVGKRRRSRASSGPASSEGEEERERRQQHGWIVGDSHKKLVTMLAHAKGRKRNHDDKRHNLD